ncbi:hypothetical protein, partial [Citrobacter youngae]|uniref:hypothetical protein n=1 Tax=Citrobacter youngae TaxID=133448 RepID=UPI00195324A3
LSWSSIALAMGSVLQAFQTALRQAEAQNDGMKQAEYHAKLEEIDAYTAPARAAKLLNGDLLE